MRQKTEDDEKRKYLIEGGLDPRAVTLMNTQSLDMGVRAMSDDLIAAKGKESELADANILGKFFQDIDKADSFNAMKKTEYFYNVAHLNMIGERIYNKLLIDTIDKRGIFTTGHALQTE